MSDTFSLEVNGRSFSVSGVAPHTTLLRWLRDNGLTGSKEGCAEGDCGACTVAVVEQDAHGTRTYRAINSCIALVPMFAGKEVVTVEGMASGDTLHPVQQAMVERYGSQCGYCTPGFVASMFEGYYRDELHSTTPEKIAEQLHGNLCRCTGYRPIRDAMADALDARDRQKAGDLFSIRLLSSAPAVLPLDYSACDERFFRPTTLSSLLALMAEHPTAQLIAGATEIGVELNKKQKAFPRLISTEAVDELRAVERRERGWRIGGAATLTAVAEALDGSIPALDKMLWVFASRQIRHRATVAGNLVTASPIGDLAPVLLALDARVLLAKLDRSGAIVERELPLAEFFVAYRKTAMQPGEMVRAIDVPDAPVPARRIVDTFKVSKRRELDISIVAAGFCLDLDESDKIVRARLAYGGVAATPIRALSTEALLLGRTFSRPVTMQMETLLAEASALLGQELAPIDDVRSGSAYRRGLIVSLLEKFFRGESSEAQDGALAFARTPKATPTADSSRTLHHESGRGHVTGGARYVDDEAHRRGAMLELWPVLSPHAHAKILRRDATAARALRGVAAVLMAEDIPGTNDVGAVRHDETLLAKDEVCFHGHMVAVVVGESYEICRQAAALVEVDYEVLPAIVGLEAAIAAQSFHTEPHHIRRSDAAAALAQSPHTLSGTIAIGGQEHFYLEAQAAWAELGDDGDIFVASSTQHPSEIQTVVSHVLHLPRHRVVVRSPRMGGGFGGKETQGNGWAALVALAATVTKRPVRVQLDRDVDMQLTGKRHPFLVQYSVGFDESGRLLALVASLVSDGGWALDLSESICDRALFHIDNSYFIPAVDVVGRVAKTHCVSHTAFRGFGGPQGMVVIEEIIDRVARTLGRRPEAVRHRNLYRGTGESNTTHYGQHIDDNRIEKIWATLERSAAVEERRRELDDYNRHSARIKRGLGMTPVKFGISFTASFLNQAGALVLLYRDGTAQVNHGGTEMGQGLYTKMAGVAMRELGLRASEVRVMKTQTDKVPNTSATAASAGADLNGAAVRAACLTLRERLLPVAQKILADRGIAGEIDPAKICFADGWIYCSDHPTEKVPFAALCDRAHLEQISLSATGYYKTPGIAYDKQSGRGRPFYYFAFGAAVSEVEVDGYSGMKRVRRVDILHDVGDSLHPDIDRGQIEGGFVQGVGWLTGEELKWDARGRLLTHSASTYQIPAFSDAPFELNVELLPDAAQAGTIHGSKAVGEPPLMLALSVREAIRDAVAAFGAEPGQVVELGCPATHEAIYQAITALR